MKRIFMASLFLFLLLVISFPAQGETWESFFSDGLINSAGQPVSLSQLDGKMVGIFFGGHWCPPCQMFSPTLVEFRNQHSDVFEVVFVSNDRNEEAMFDYMKAVNMPWPAVAFSSTTRKTLADKYGVNSIPSVIIVSPTGKTISSAGTSDIMTNPAGCIDQWMAGSDVAPQAGGGSSGLANCAIDGFMYIVHDEALPTGDVVSFNVLRLPCGDEIRIDGIPDELNKAQAAEIRRKIKGLTKKGAVFTIFDDRIMRMFDAKGRRIMQVKINDKSVLEFLPAFSEDLEAGVD